MITWLCDDVMPVIEIHVCSTEVYFLKKWKCSISISRKSWALSFGYVLRVPNYFIPYKFWGQRVNRNVSQKNIVFLSAIWHKYTVYDLRFKNPLNKTPPPFGRFWPGTRGAGGVLNIRAQMFQNLVDLKVYRSSSCVQVCQNLRFWHSRIAFPC